MRIRKALIACVAASVFVYGCGGGATVKTSTSTVSVGQQLIDLKKALDTGSMTQSQYDKAKRDLIKSVLSN